VASSHRLVTPPLDHEPKQQNEARYNQPQDYPEIASGDSQAPRCNQQDAANGE
jgi:hypothetical protein